MSEDTTEVPLAQTHQSKMPGVSGSRKTRAERRLFLVNTTNHVQVKEGSP